MTRIALLAALLFHGCHAPAQVTGASNVASQPQGADPTFAERADLNAGPSSLVPEEAGPEDAINAALAELEPLPIPQACWPNTPKPFYAELSRVLGTASVNIRKGHEISAEWHFSEAKATGLPAVLFYSPNADKFRTDADPDDIDTQVLVDRELEYFKQRVQQAQEYGLQIAWVSMDSEHYSVAEVPRAWIAGYHWEFEKILDGLGIDPDTQLSWYGHRGEQLAPNALGYDVDDNTAGTESGNPCVTLYRLMEIGSTVDQLNATVTRSIKERRGGNVDVWISTTGAYSRTVTDSQGRPKDLGRFIFNPAELVEAHT